MKAIKRLVLRPKLNLDEAEKQFKGKFLDRSHYDLLVSDDLMGVLPSGEPKFLFVRNVLYQDGAQMIWERLGALPFQKGRRFRNFRLQGSRGGEMLMGWIEDVQPGGRQIRMTRPTRKHCIEYGFIIIPLLGCVSGVLKEYLPDYWRDQEARAGRNGQRLVGFVLQESDNIWRIGAGGRKTKLTKENTEYPLFSTVTINQSLLFPAHVDAKNESGLACVMAFGRFAGGNLCLPRLRLAFRLRPGDLLIADTNREVHGNIGPIAGERISVVCYLRDLSQKKEPKTATGAALSHRRGQ
jgi:hypothetical protein